MWLEAITFCSCSGLKFLVRSVLGYLGNSRGFSLLHTAWSDLIFTVLERAFCAQAGPRVTTRQSLCPKNK